MTTQHVPRTNQDKRQSVLTCLKDPTWQQWSDGAIARHCGVTQPFVSRLRRSLKTVLSEGTPLVSDVRRYRDRYGHASTMRTQLIGLRRAAPLTPGGVQVVLTGDEARLYAAISQSPDGLTAGQAERALGSFALGYRLILKRLTSLGVIRQVGTRYHIVTKKG